LSRLSRFGLDGILMKPNCAVAAALAAFGLLALVLRHRRIALINGVAIAVLGAAKLIEHLAHVGVGLTSVSLTDLWTDEVAVVPGKIGLLASIGFALMGMGLAASAARKKARIGNLAPWFGLCAAFVSLLAMTGYLFGADQSHAVPHLARFAVQSAAVNLCLGLALILAFPDRQPLRTFLADSAAGLLARRALPFVLVVPLALGWLYVVGQDAGLHDTSTGSAVLILALIVLMCFILGWGVNAVGSREEVLETLQEERIRAELVLKSARDQFVILDQDWRLAYANDRFAEVAGRVRASMLGRDLRELWPGVIDSPLEAAIRKVGQERSETTLEFFDSATKHWFDVRLYPARDGGIALLFLDITDRTALEEELKQRLAALIAAKERLRSVVDHVVDGIITIDEFGVVQSLNPSAELLFGYPASEVIGRNIRMLMPDPYQSNHDDYLANYMRTGIPRIIGIGREVLGLRSDGSTFPMDLAVSTYTLEQRRYFTGIIRDITERKTMEGELHQLVDELRAVDQRKDEFLATLAHELRNPLSPLRNSLEILKQPDLAPTLVESARETMERQVSLMERLIDDLMDVSRITRSRVELRREIVELQSVLQQALDLSRPLATQRNHTLEADLPDGSIPLDADPIRLAQVFGNLLANACKYTEPGGHIRLTAERHKHRVQVTIADDGIGIPGTMLHRIFDMFTQVDGTSERAHGGLGIGLTLAKRLVELHGGNITAHSDGPGAGSRFIVELPIADSVVQPVPNVLVDQVESIRGLRVLIVDDNRDAATSLASLLRLSGGETQVAHDGLEAVERAKEFMPHAILLDIGLPKRNGFDVCRSIRQTEWGKNAIILALTGWGQEEDRRKSKQAGFDGHMIKPVEKTALLKALSRQLQHS
jgi:PAS domain S-box-containing protein